MKTIAQSVVLATALLIAAFLTILLLFINAVLTLWFTVLITYTNS